VVFEFVGEKVGVVKVFDDFEGVQFVGIHVLSQLL